MAAVDEEPIPLDQLASRAGGVRVAVVGGGIAGLVAALECAKVGLQVTLFEASERLGGTCRTALLDGMAVDTGADCFAARGREPAALIESLGLTGQIVAPQTGRRWLAGLAGHADAVPMPEDVVLGIPENMWSDECRTILGTGGTWRAYVDRLRPPLTIGHERSLAALVRSRMGQKVLDRLVAPVTAGVFGVRPADVDVEIAAPGLNAALTRTGSLSGAVATLRADRGDGPATQSLSGGMGRLVDALASRLEEFGATVLPGVSVTAVERTGVATEWILHTDADEFDASDEAAPPHRFDAVIVATGERAARRLLDPVVPELSADVSAAAEVETVTLVLDAPALGGAPRGAEIITMPGSRPAAGALHLSAKWEWLARAAGVGRHVVRVSFGGTPPATAGLGDADAVELARAEASALFGVPLEQTQVRAADRARFTLAPPLAVTGRRAFATRVRSAVEAVPRLAATGSWLAGSGLAQVIPDAQATADRLRRRALFGGGSPS
ncbi:protoporphyrinogen oxidase [Microbacterium kribbense]|uniref:Protoporphyrinogen oxidase n=1 Tax=Microbacterium kribbense TaxID=433645 RepID=A0ABP7GCF9_9MICO